MNKLEEIFYNEYFKDYYYDKSKIKVNYTNLTSRIFLVEFNLNIKHVFRYDRVRNSLTHNNISVMPNSLKKLFVKCFIEKEV